ncbi:MAG: LptA/OstA family protein [Acidobacteriota bacterium]|nr:LptA/OstA family protein [Acidobacteriota bacterium]
MRNRIERLRLWLVAGACLLLAVVGLFIGSAHYLRRHALARLSSRLGVDIKSETSGFTYSQSVQGRTIYTIHAAKEVEHVNGTITLHDVSMVLYGRTGDRADMVYGKDFEYNQSAGMLRALGLVHIDLGAAGSGRPGAPPLTPLADGEDDAGGGPRLLHATTSGLVYLDKLGVAATSQAIEFQTGQMKGHAVGADYSTDTGVLLLHSAVSMNGVVGGRPVELTAASAQLDQRGRRTLLSQARYVSGVQTMQADHAKVFTGADNALERIEAEGHLALARGAGTVQAVRGNVTFAAKNNAQTVVLAGGVRYVEDLPLRQGRGEAADATIIFDARGAAHTAVFSGDVHMTQRTRTHDDAREPWSVRELAAPRVETTLGDAGLGRTALRDAHAVGGARLRMVENRPGTAAAGAGTTTELAGDDLVAHLLPVTAAEQAPRLDTVAARGHTVLHQIAADGVEQTSSGDSLEARFAPEAPRSGTSHGVRAGELGPGQLVGATQQGHVHLARSTPPRPGAAAVPPEEATADHAGYDGVADRLTLTGGVRLSNGDNLLAADRVALDRTTGNMQAEGAVKVSYTQQAATRSGAVRQSAPGRGQDPLHVVADRAELDHTSDVTTFHGRPVRVWQGGSQIQAPVVELARRQRRMTARAEDATPAGSGRAEPVHAVLPAVQGGPGASPAATRSTTGAPASASAAGSPVQIDAGVLIYSEATRQAQFNGGVRMMNSGETMSARTATAFLRPADGSKAGAAAKGAEADLPAAGSGGFALGGAVERVVASGAIVVEQPGLHATGERLVYTAADQMVLLTGTPAAEPRVLDRTRGSTVTAPAFRFHTTDRSVEALGAAPGESPAPDGVHADTPVRH